MSGLELIAKTAETDLVIEFIILSGYADFEYATGMTPRSYAKSHSVKPSE